MKQSRAQILTITDDNISCAAAELSAGNVLAFPTETVYGLGANAYDAEAVAKIYTAKGRPSFNPLISHYKNAEAAFKDVIPNDAAYILAQKFWPGPLTLILPRAKDSPLCNAVTAGLETAAVRVPAHDVAQALLTRLAFPLAAPSANSSGEVSPTRPTHVLDSLGTRIDYILAQGACTIGLESTVLDLSREDAITILRPGAVTKEQIEDALGEAIHTDFTAKSKETGDEVRSPGQLLRHYAPRLPLRLRAVDVASDEALISFGSTKFMSIKGGGRATDLPDNQHISLSAEGDLNEAAAGLFNALRIMDQPDRFTAIAVMDIPKIGLGIAINERLERAAAATSQMHK